MLKRQPEASRAGDAPCRGPGVIFHGQLHVLQQNIFALAQKCAYPLSTVLKGPLHAAESVHALRKSRFFLQLFVSAATTTAQRLLFGLHNTACILVLVRTPRTAASIAEGNVRTCAHLCVLSLRCDLSTSPLKQGHKRSWLRAS